MLLEMMESKYKKYLTEEWIEGLQMLSKIQEYVSVVEVEDNRFQEFEVLSFNAGADVDGFRKMFEQKSKDLKENYLKEQGFDLKSKVEIQQSDLQIHTELGNLDSFIEQFLSYIEERSKEILHNNNKGEKK